MPQSATDRSHSGVPPESIPPIPSVLDEDAARTRIRRSRTLATALLLGMALVFVGASLAPNAGVGVALLRAASEAGIVGGLADWFAVTALFRRPLGLPIPHTGILPANKDRIGRALGAFVERSFLTEAVLVPRLRAAKPGRRLAEWLSSAENVPLIVDPVVAALPQIVSAVENPELRAFLNEAVGDQLRAVDLAPIVGRFLEILTQSGEADLLFKRAVDAALQWLNDNRAEIDKLVAQRSRWWMPPAVDRRIARTIVEGITDVLNGLSRPDSDTRKKFHEALAAFIGDLMRSPERREEWNETRNRLLRHPEVQAWLNMVWSELAQALRADVAKPASGARAVLEKAVLSIGQSLAADHVMQGKINRNIELLIMRVIPFRGEIGRFMAEVIRSWDADTLAARLELVIGSDLQYIRMNGTIVGALVGCALFLLASVIH